MHTPKKENKSLVLYMQLRSSIIYKTFTPCAPNPWKSFGDRCGLCLS